MEVRGEPGGLILGAMVMLASASRHFDGAAARVFTASEKALGAALIAGVAGAFAFFSLQAGGTPGALWTARPFAAFGRLGARGRRPCTFWL